MRANIPSALVLWAAFGLALSAASANAGLIYDYSPYGGTGSYLISVTESDPVDVDKSITDPDDDHMCWAAAASNILDWGGWGRSPLDHGQSMFQTFQDNWQDYGGLMLNAWSWWINGDVLQPRYDTREPGAAGGNYFPSIDFEDYYYHYSQGTSWANLPNALEEIDALLQDGWGVTVAVAPISHALTVWGYQADMVYDPLSGTYSKEYRAL